MPDIETLISAAEAHGEDSDPGHEVGDLQDLLRLAWKHLPTDARNAFMSDEEVQRVYENATGEMLPA